METFGIQYEMGQPGVSEDNARFAQIWDGPVLVASLIRSGDRWIVDNIDPDYVGVDFNAGELETVSEVVKMIDQALELV